MARWVELKDPLLPTAASSVWVQATFGQTVIERPGDGRVAPPPIPQRLGHPLPGICISSSAANAGCPPRAGCSGYWAAHDAVENTGVRKPLGELLSRKVKSKQLVEKLPGAPDGKYVVIQYDATFQNKASAVETVTPMLDPDGQWRVSGYFIK